MALPNLSHRPPDVKLGLKVSDVRQWTETSSDLYVVAEGEL